MVITNHCTGILLRCASQNPVSSSVSRLKKMKRNSKIGKQRYFGSSPTTNKLLACLKDYINLLEKTNDHIAAIKNKNTNPISISIYENSRAIYLLAKHNQNNEAWMVARSLLERIIVLNYLVAEGSEAFKDYLDYGTAYSYRLMEETTQVNDKILSGKIKNKIDLDKDPKTKEAVEKFTRKNSGKPKQSWVSKTTLQMLKVIEEKSEINILPLMEGMNMLYPDASEALHGTMRGVTFHYAHDPHYGPNTEETMKDDYFGSLTTLLAIVIQLIYLEITESIKDEQKYHVDDKALLLYKNKAKKLLLKLQSILGPLDKEDVSKHQDITLNV